MTSTAEAVEEEEEEEEEPLPETAPLRSHSSFKCLNNLFRLVNAWAQWTQTMGAGIIGAPVFF